MKTFRKDLLAVVFLALLITIFFAREIFTDQTLVTFRLTNVFPWLAEASPSDLEQPSVTSDCTFSYYPRRVFATEMIRQGQIPYWNPYQFCGTPFLATFQTMVFYPVNLVLYGLDPPTQMDLFLYVHFLIAAVFSYLFARQLGLSWRASVISAISFTFSGFMVTRYGQPTFISTASWMPAVLLFTDRLIERPGLRRAGLLALVISLCILAGFPQLVLLVLYTAGAYLILRLALNRRWPVRWKAAVVLFLILAVGVACLITAFQLLPTYELSGFSYRKVLSYNMVLSSAHHPLVGLKYFIPDILGDPRDIGVLGKNLKTVEQGPAFAQNYVSTTGYIGILPILLAVLALSAPSRRMIPFVVLSAITLLVVFGSDLLYVFYRLVPGFNFSRIDRVIIVYMTAMSFLAGYGFDILRSQRGPSRGRYVALGFAVFMVTLAGWLRLSGLDSIYEQAGGTLVKAEYLGYAYQKIYMFLLTGGLAVAILALRSWRWFAARALFIAAVAVLMLDLVPNGMGFKVSQPAAGILPQSSFISDLKRDRGLWRFAKYGVDQVPANTATLLGLSDIHGYDALNINHYIEVLGAIDSSMIAVSNAALRRRIGPISQAEALESKVMNLLNVKYVLTAAEGGQQRWRNVALLNTGALPRAFLVYEARTFDTYPEVLAYMKTAEFEPDREVLLKPDGKMLLEPGEPAGTGHAEVLEFHPNDLTIEAETDRPCYLVVSEVFYPGWQVLVDGRQEELLRADYAFRAVRIDAGKHRVRMVFVPQSFRIGLLFSIAGVCLAAVMLSNHRQVSW